ncbi:hypothetical protein Nepgr_022119 [Nepenthes gracilis]|uniref:Small subunit processome component 20 homolog n=1 Tax=Nepenthes gracilis TaxID=150966 RepID=A0AAD3XWN7_NEPGR|nr:hypothetical protein Nepgr_022119 [Nepenthes gracilis]
MATVKEAQAVKSLNRTPGRRNRRFVFKTFSQRIQDIEVDVFRSLEPMKSEPSPGSSFFLDCLIQWRELNTAEDFISFYEEMMPFVQTLPLVLLHKELIISKLLSRLQMEGRLSLEPILRLIAELSRDLLEDFLPFLPRISESLLALLQNGAERQPEIIEQIFTSWSYITMYLQKYLTRDIIRVLKVTIRLRFYPKDFVQVFMAEAIAFLLRNAPVEQLIKGVRKIILEVARKPSQARKSGASAILWHVMRGTSSKFHSRAEQVLRLLIDHTILSIGDEVTKGSESILEAVSGSFKRLCMELNSKDLKLMWDCLYEEITDCVSHGNTLHLTRLLAVLISVLSFDKGRHVPDYKPMLELVALLVQTYILPSSIGNAEDQTGEAVKRILQLMSCTLDGLQSLNEVRAISSIALLWAPTFELRNSSLMAFLKELLDKDPCILSAFRNNILRSCKSLVETAEEEVTYVILTLCWRLQVKAEVSILEGIPEDVVSEISHFFHEKISSWIGLINDIIRGDLSCGSLDEAKLALLWGIICCYPCIMDNQLSASLLLNFVDVLDQMLNIESGDIAGLPRHTWQSLIGAALSSYHKLTMAQVNKPEHTSRILDLAKRYKSSPQILSSVADFLDFMHGSTYEANTSCVTRHPKLEAVKVMEALNIFAQNLCNADKRIRVATLRILCHYEPFTGEFSVLSEPVQQDMETEVSNDKHSDTQCCNVLQLLLSIEETPITVATSRKLAILVSKVQIGLSAARIYEPYIPLVLNGIIGILHNQFRDLSTASLECLAVMMDKFSQLVWDHFIVYLNHCQDTFLQTQGQDTDTSVEASTESDNLLERFHSFSSVASCSRANVSILSLLLQALQKIPTIVETHSSQVIPLFFKYLGYTDGNPSCVGSFDSQVCTGKDWKGVLNEWLSLLQLFRNPRSVYCSLVLKEVLVNRLLDATDPEIQMKVLDILLNWKDGFLLPYGKQLKNLVSSKNLREELTTWSLSKGSDLIEEGHREELVPLVIRLLIPKIRNLKTLAHRKHASMNSRRAVLGFIAQLDVGELPLFFALLLKPLQTREYDSDAAPDSFWGSTKNTMDEFQVIDYLKFFTMENILALAWKKRYGFLHVVEDILSVFDEYHVRPFLDLLSGCTVRMLRSCSLSLCRRNNRSVQLESQPIENMPIHGNDDEAVSQMMSNLAVKQFKDLRSLCLKIMSLILSKYEDHDFGSELWDEFFASVKPLVDGFRQEGSSSEKPSSLFSCFLVMSRSHNLVSLLCREENLVPNIFSILSVVTASEGVLTSVLKFIENLLSLDIELENESNVVRKVLFPNLGVLIYNLHDLFHNAHQRNRKLVEHPGEIVLGVFRLLSKFIKDPLLAKEFVDILLLLVCNGAKNSDVCIQALQILRQVVPILGGERTTSILNTLSPLLVFADLDMRQSICDLLIALAQKDSSIYALAELICELNATSAMEIGDLDYDTIVNAYDKINVEYFYSVREAHALMILSNCIHGMSSGELILRHSAYRSLISFVEFCALICRQEEKNQEMSERMMEVGNSPWTKAGIRRIVNKFLLKHMGDAMSKGTSVQKEWLELLREMVLKLSEVPNLKNLSALSSQDAEIDFFYNITHLQKHRRARALLRFKNIVTTGKLSDSEFIMKRVFVPLFFNMLFDLPKQKEEHLRSACLNTLASISGQMEWKSYHAMLMRCFRDMIKRPDTQKILLRLVCSILDEFNFFRTSSMNDAEDLADNVESGVPNPLLVSVKGVSPATISEIQSSLVETVLPKLQRLLASDSERVNINISLAVLKVLKLLPGNVMESHLPNIVHRIANFLKNRLESIRDEARSALAACLKELGVAHLQFIVRALKGTLKRGFELHVLGYTLNFILSKGYPNPTSGELDYCLDDLLNVVENDILGHVAEEKDVEKVAFKMKETRRRMSFDTLKLISQSVMFKTHALKLLSPVTAYQQKHLSPKVKSKLESMLNHIAAGIEHNPSVNQTDLFIFIYGLVDDGITEETRKYEGSRTDEHSTTEGNIKMGMRYNPGVEAVSSHLITVFALGLFLNHLRNIKIDKSDGLLLSMIDPFVKLLMACLNSKYEEVLSVSLKCISQLIRLPLPSLESHTDKLKATLLDIAQSSANATSPIMQSCLRLLTELLRSSKVTLSREQLHVLIQFPVFVDLEKNPCFVALSLLKAIVCRKLVVHEIYDVVTQVAEVMVTSQVEPIRKRCSQILLQFLLNYQLSQKRMQQHLDFLITNLRYEYATGREAVLEMLRVIIEKFPQRFVDEHSQALFVPLVERLANDPDNQVRSLIGTAIQLLVGRTSSHSLDSILKCSLAWYLGEKQLLWSTSAQVLGLLVEVMKKGFQKHISTVLLMSVKEDENSRMMTILQAAVKVLVSEKLDYSDQPMILYWKEAYYSLVLFQKILLQFPEVCFEKYALDIWEAISQLLMHPHPWIRSISSRLVALYFTQTSLQGQRPGTNYLTRTSKLLMVAVSQCCQLRAQLLDDDAYKLVMSNLVFTVCGIHTSTELEECCDPHTFWSTLDLHERACFLKACCLLDARKGRSIASLLTCGFGNQNDQENSKDLRHILISSILETMGKIAVEMGDIQTKTVVRSLQLIASQIGQDGSQLYATQLLLPLYRLCEGFAGKVFSDEVKQQSDEVRQSIQEILGDRNFIQAYSQIRSNLKAKRDRRKKAEKLMAVVDPTRNAKRKLRIASKHRAHKRRKIMSMKMSRWMH